MRLRWENTDLIKARFAAEFSNGPVGAEADDQLSARRVPIIRDFLCKAGGLSCHISRLCGTGILITGKKTVAIPA
jgi:glutamate dehydrogenase/leucine dehydrogenase